MPNTQSRAASRDAGNQLVLAVAVCFLNEEELLPQLLRSIDRQTRPPDRIVLVDDGSTDASAAIAEEFAASRPGALVMRRPVRAADRDRLAQAAELLAFQFAAREIPRDWDVLGKLDADIRLSPQVCETLEQQFLADPRLGIAGTYLSVLTADGRTVREPCPPGHVRGATKFYRRDCYEAIGPVPAILGWDTIDEISARMHGWRTRSFETPDGDSMHLRPTATHDGALRGYRRIGRCAWGYGAHPLHVAAGTVSRFAQRPRVLGGLNYALGFGLAAVRRAPRAQPDVCAFGRSEQLQRLRLRALSR